MSESEKQINHQIVDEGDLSPDMIYSTTDGLKHHLDSHQSLAARIATKLEEGDFMGAVCLACSEHSVAEENVATIAAFKSKHPKSHPDTCFHPHPRTIMPLVYVTRKRCGSSNLSFF